MKTRLERLRKSKTLPGFVLMVAIIYLSLLLPSYCFACASSFIRQVQEIEAERDKSEWMMTIFAPVFTEDCLNEYKDASNMEIKYFSARYEDIVISDGRMISVTVSGTEEVSGTDIVKDETGLRDGECTITEQLAEEAHLSRGDLLYIREQKYVIRRIIKSAVKDRAVRITYHDMQKEYGGYYIQQTIGGSKEALDELSATLCSDIPDLKIIAMEESALRNSETEAFLKEMILSRILVMIAALLIGAVNIVILVMSQMRKKTHHIGVHMAYGAGYTDILWIIISDYALEFTCAAILLMSTFKGVMIAADLENEAEIDLGGCVAITLCTALLLTTLSAVAAFKFCRKKATDLLEERV